MLFAKYLAIGLFAAATFAGGIVVWVYLPHSATGASFVVLELVTLMQIISRLWLKAASARAVLQRSSEITPPPIRLNEAPVDEAPVADIPASELGSPLPE